MRIAFVVHDYNRSAGHSRYVAELATRFAAGHDVHVFANTFDAPGAEQVTYHHVPAIRATALTTVLSFLATATAVVRGAFDVVHTQGVCGWRRTDVVTAHICNASWFRARRDLGDDFRAHERLFAAVVNPLERRFYGSGRGGHVVAVSNRVAEDLRREYGSTSPTSVIHHGVDAERFTPAVRSSRRSAVRARHGLSDDDVVFLYVGDLRKGALGVIEALARVPSARALFVSRSSPETYRRAAADKGVVGRVDFAPPTDAIEDYYAAADAFVFPSPYDAFGMVVSEAMASGLPVVASPEAGASEIITDGVDGYVVTGIDALAARMAELAADGELRARIGVAARRRVEALSWDRVADETMAVYRLAAGL